MRTSRVTFLIALLSLFAIPVIAQTNRWQISLGGGGGAVEGAVAVTTDSLGNAVVIGNASSGGTFGTIGVSQCAFIAKISPSGNWLWAKALRSSDSACVNRASVTTDSRDGIYVAFNMGSTFGSTLIQGYTAEGTRLWEKSSTGNAGTRPDSIGTGAIDAAGNGFLYLIGARRPGTVTFGSLSGNGQPGNGSVVPSPGGIFIVRLAIDDGTPEVLQLIDNYTDLTVERPYGLAVRITGTSPSADGIYIAGGFASLWEVKSSGDKHELFKFDIPGLHGNQRPRDTPTPASNEIGVHPAPLRAFAARLNSSLSADIAGYYPEDEDSQVNYDGGRIAVTSAGNLYVIFREESKAYLWSLGPSVEDWGQLASSARRLPEDGPSAPDYDHVPTAPIDIAADRSSSNVIYCSGVYDPTDPKQFISRFEGTTPKALTQITSTQPYKAPLRLAVSSRGHALAAGGIAGDATFTSTGVFTGGTPPAATVSAPAARVYLARMHASVTVGSEVPRPAGTVAQAPQITLLDSYPGCTAQNAFYWSLAVQKLYAVCPVSARLEWPVSTDPTNTARVTSISSAVWPDTPQRHIAGAPANLALADAGRSYVSILHTESQGASDGTKTFNAPSTGHSVLLFVDGASPNPADFPPRLLVIRTVAWNDPSILRANQACTIGTALSDVTHADYPEKSGFVYFPRSHYDGLGNEAAHNRATRVGPIIPVNPDTSATDDDMVVVWYAKDMSTGTAWPVKPTHYSCEWPANPPRIIMANEQGSDYGNQPKLDPVVYRNMRIYDQRDPLQPGFNPNEEHAMFAPSQKYAGFNALYALRQDLGANPYVLLKYVNADATWAFQVYAVVVGADATGTMSFPGTAGLQIRPPYPLSVLASCTNPPNATELEGSPLFTDHKNQPWARSAGIVTAEYRYPLQAGFAYDNDGNGSFDAVTATGTCIPWRFTSQVKVRHVIDWPWPVPVLHVGQTLTGATNGLPDILSQAAAAIVYDDSDPDLTSATRSLATLMDPLTPVRQALNSLPPDIQKIAVEGSEIAFDALPPDLRSRFRYDPLQKQLSFKGIRDASLVGDPLLLLNVMTPRERDAILALSQNDVFKNAVRNLYHRSRNPRGLDIDNNGAPDEALLVGLQEKPDHSGFERFRTLGISGALTAGRPRDALWTASNVNGFDAARVRDGSTAATAFDWNVAGNSSVVVDFGPARAIRQFEVSTTSLAGNPSFAHSDDGVNWTAIAGVTSSGVSDFGALEARGYDIPVSAGAHRFWRIEKSTTAAENTVFTEIEPREFPGARHAAASWTGVNLRNLYAGRINDGDAATDAFDWNTSGAASTAVNLGSAKTIRQFDVSMKSFAADPLISWSDDGTNWTTVTPDATTIVPFAEVTTRKYRLPASAGSHQWWRISKSSAAGEATVFTEVWPRESADGTPGTTGYVTLAFNNDPSLGSLPVGLSVIRVDCDPYLGQIQVLEPQNVFDEKLTLRHSGDFGGDPSDVRFEWYVHTTPPEPAPGLKEDFSVDPANDNGWRLYQAGQGLNSITLEGANLETLSDNYFLVRYSGYPFCSNATRPTAFAGAPGGTAQDQRPQLAEGWIKRVITGFNPFEARVTDFHKAATATYASMLQIAGERYEGDIAFNPDAANVNSLGLIQAYETVLRRGMNLSVSAGVNYPPANDQLLFAASRVSDFYMLLGNESFADASDPTIGFGTQSGQYGSLAPSIFTFQNQLASLLDEELTLLRGRDDTSAAVAAAPIYNRLLWNFTSGEGELAYAQNYAVKDMDSNGLVNAVDARIMFPQGHGDAWGHYLTALTTYYRLLRNSNYTWLPRSEAVSVLGAPVQVDFLDERKFAAAAAALARTGAQLVDLTYRRDYVEDPAGQWKGYGDSVANRAWGVIDWARRGGQSAYFNWAATNSLLPDVDPESCEKLGLSPGTPIPGNPSELCHSGITRVDRASVAQIGEIVSHADEIQAQIDKVDAGLNPLGLAKNVVPFDIDPSLIAAGKTHFEQIYDRAFSALTNTIVVWDHINQLGQSLRRNQDTLAGFTTNVQQRERDFKNRLIEIFGYPYPDDIGPGKTYPNGYDEADIYHYMYVDLPDLTGGTTETEPITGYFKPIPNIGDVIGSFNPDAFAIKQVTYDVTQPQGDFGPTLFAGLLVKPTTWAGVRRAPGEIQHTLSDMLQARARYQQAVQNYENLIEDIRGKADSITARSDQNGDKIKILRHQLNQTITLNDEIKRLTATSIGLRRTSETIQAIGQAMIDSLPTVVGVATDASFVARGLVYAGFLGATQGLEAAADDLNVQMSSHQLAKEEASLSTSIEIERQNLEAAILTAVGELETLIRREPGLRLEAIALREAMNQSAGKYRTALAGGLRVLDDLAAFRASTASSVQQYRYEDMTFRVFRNDALQKYRAQFDLAARYVYLAATAYDYETNLLGSASGSGQNFLTSIVRHRSLGQILNGVPIAGSRGLADPLARLSQNFAVLKGQMGFNNPQTETNRFSLRTEHFRLLPASDEAWRQELQSHVVSNLWDIPEFRRYCRPFALESAGPQPGLVIPLNTTVTSGQNFFGMPLVGGDSAYDASHFATKIRSAGVWFSNYDGTGLSNTPRIYLVPVGADTMRSPSGNLEIREWSILDQRIPVPLSTGATDLTNPNWIPIDDGLSDTFGDVRRYSSFRAYHDSGSFSTSEMTTDTRLIGRSVWNTRWLLIIPGATFLQSPTEGLQTLIEGMLLPDGTRAHNGISDIKIFFQTYAYSGN